MARLAHLDKASVVLGGLPILDRIDFTLAPAQIAGVTGPNGSGKTTLLRALATLVRIDSGSGEVLGVDLRTDEVTSVRRWIGMIGHNPTMIPHLTLWENLDHVARLTSQDRSRVEKVLHVVGLDEVSGRRAKDSSFGMQRRLEIARLLLTQPRFVLLDESLSGLDTEAAELVEATIDRTISRDGGVVMVSHDMKLLEETCQSLYRLDEGRLEQLA